MRRILLALFLIILTLTAVAHTQTTIAIKCGKLFDGKSDKLLGNQIIIVENNRIAAVAAYPAPPPYASMEAG